MHASTQRKCLVLRITFLSPFDEGVYWLFAAHETGRVGLCTILNDHIQSFFVSSNDVTALQNSAKIDLDNRH